MGEWTPNSQALNSSRNWDQVLFLGTFTGRKFIVSNNGKKALKKKKKTSDFKKTPREYHFPVSLADAHQSLFRYNTTDCSQARSNTGRDAAVLLGIPYEAGEAPGVPWAGRAKLRGLLHLPQHRAEPCPSQSCCSLPKTPASAIQRGCTGHSLEDFLISSSHSCPSCWGFFLSLLVFLLMENRLLFLSDFMIIHLDISDNFVLYMFLGWVVLVFFPSNIIRFVLNSKVSSYTSTDQCNYIDFKDCSFFH